MTTIHQGMRKSEQTFAKRASEHIRHLLSSGTPLGSLGFTICLSTQLSLVAYIQLSIKSQLSFNSLQLISFMAIKLLVMVAAVAGLMLEVGCLTMKVEYPSTCLKLHSEYENDNLLINFHQNLKTGSSQLKVYNLEGAMIADSGQGPTYQHYLQVLLPTKGEYRMCFENFQAKQLQVSFEILREEEQLSYVGKEDLGRITRRVNDFLIEIKKSSWQYKQLLAQHNKWAEKFRDYEATNYTLYGLKLAAMVCVLSVQIWIVKKVFD